MIESTVTESVYSDVRVIDGDGNEVSFKDEFLNSMNDFFQHHIVDTVDSSIQVFQSFTYGEMVISLLLLCILLVSIFKWIWSVFR